MNVPSRLSRGLSTASLVAATSIGLPGCVIPESAVGDSVVLDTIARSKLPMALDSLPRNTRFTASPTPGSPAADAELVYLRNRQLLIPVTGVRAAELVDMFDEGRSQGRRHNAIDIAAPRGTPVLSVDDGRIARIDTSDRGGLSLYAADPSGRFVYYYAHLDRYHAGMRNGMPVARGDTIGFVGTTGNAPRNTPHLHFAISRLDDPRRWWDGTPIDPRPLLTGTR